MFATFNIQKIKSMNELYARVAHNKREKVSSNIVKAKSHKNEGMTKASARDIVNHVEKGFRSVQSKREREGANALRKSTVKAVEIVLGASHEFFASPYSTDEEVEEWAKANLEWAKEYYAGRGKLVDSQIHFDETTPHIHFMFVPITEKVDKKTGKTLPTFSAKEFMGNKVEMNKARDSHASAMAKFGLRRGRNYFREGEKPPAYVKDIKQLRRKTAAEIESLDISDLVDYINGNYVLNKRTKAELNNLYKRKDKKKLIEKAKTLPVKSSPSPSM